MLSFGPSQNVSASAAWSYVLSEPLLAVNEQLAPTSGVYAGSVITHTITISDAGSSSDAFGLNVTNVISALLHIVPGSLTVVGGFAGSVTVVSGNASGDSVLQVLIDRFDLTSASPIVITFSTVVDQTAQLGSTITANPVDLTYLTAPTNGRPFNTTSGTSPSVTLNSISGAAATLSPVDSNVPAGLAAPGELIYLDVALSLDKGSSSSLVVSLDLAPYGSGAFTYLNSSLLTGPSVVCGNNPPVVSISGSLVSFDFGAVVNNISTGNSPGTPDVLALRVAVTASASLPQNVAGSLVGATGSAVLSFGPTTAFVTANLTLGEPVLLVAVSLAEVATGAAVDAGALFDVTVTIDHDVASSVPAYDLLLISDLLGSDLVLPTATFCASPILSTMDSFPSLVRFA